MRPRRRRIVSRKTVFLTDKYFLFMLRTFDSLFLLYYFTFHFVFSLSPSLLYWYDVTLLRYSIRRGICSAFDGNRKRLSPSLVTFNSADAHHRDFLAALNREGGSWGGWRRWNFVLILATFDDTCFLRNHDILKKQNREENSMKNDDGNDDDNDDDDDD